MQYWKRALVPVMLFKNRLGIRKSFSCPKVEGAVF
jgi:hypothetical protein